jgi:hypothetical protein
MTTKKQENEKHEEEARRQEDAKKQEEAARAEHKRQPTDDPMATPPYDVHAPNPPSPPGGEK